MDNSKAGFYHLGIAPDVLKVLDRQKFTVPTPIQKQAIPYALEGKDIVGIAQTGTGKTLAFGIPIIQKLAADGGQALILAPTRELAIQIEDALIPFLKAFKMRSAVLIGGVKIFGQISNINANPDIIIATPGRMNDHIYQGTIDLGRVNIVVLDEADRMFDMGFEPQVKSILRCVTNKEQTMLFSATMPADILKLASKNMKLPITIEIAPQGTPTDDVSQELFIVKESDKNRVLEMLLKKYHGTVLVFIRTKLKATRITRNIKDMKVKVTEIHSNRSMGQRLQSIEGFKRGRYRVLVATDIAARGIDISMIELVINYDLPDDAENYVHRIGRTGRAGREGHAVTLATPSQSKSIKEIEDLIKMTLPRTMQADYTNNQFYDTNRKPGSRSSFGGRSSSGNTKGSSRVFKGKSSRQGQGNATTTGANKVKYKGKSTSTKLNPKSKKSGTVVKRNTATANRRPKNK